MNKGPVARQSPAIATQTTRSESLDAMIRNENRKKATRKTLVQARLGQPVDQSSGSVFDRCKVPIYGDSESNHACRHHRPTRTARCPDPTEKTVHCCLGAFSAGFTGSGGDGSSTRQPETSQGDQTHQRADEKKRRAVQTRSETRHACEAETNLN